jgi:hypothetical protein
MKNLKKDKKTSNEDSLQEETSGALSKSNTDLTGELSLLEMIEIDLNSGSDTIEQVAPCKKKLQATNKPPIKVELSQTEEGWFADNVLGPFESEALARYAGQHKGQAELITRWLKFDDKSIPKKPIEDLTFIKGGFSGGNNGIKVEDKDKKAYFLKGYAQATLLEKRKTDSLSTERTVGKQPESVDTIAGTETEDEKGGSSLEEDAIKRQFDALCKQALKNKKAIYEYIAVECYAKAGLNPPFRSHLFQDENGKVFLANDWTEKVGSVLPEERKPKDKKEKTETSSEVRKDKEELQDLEKTETDGKSTQIGNETEESSTLVQNDTEKKPTDRRKGKKPKPVKQGQSPHKVWEIKKPFVQESKAFKQGLAMDLVFGMHDMLNADNWKFVGDEETGVVVPFDFGGPFDARATALTLEEDGKQKKEGWEIPKNANAIGRWLNTATLSMLEFAEKTEESRQKSVYSGVSKSTLQESAEFMDQRWDDVLKFMEEELTAKGVHPEEIKDLMRIVGIRAKTMHMLCTNQLAMGEYLSWDPKLGLSGKFPGLQADPEGRKKALENADEESKNQPLVATVPRERVKDGGTLRTGLVETEMHDDKLCVRVYQSVFAPLNKGTLTKGYKDVYQNPEDTSIVISSSKNKKDESADTCFNVGQPLRALKWAERYMTQHGVNADSAPAVRSFLVPYEDYLSLLDQSVQQEKLGNVSNVQGMKNVDSNSATDQFELSEKQLEVLKKSAVGGTLQSYFTSEIPKKEEGIDHGETNSLRSLYDKLGVPVFADTLAGEYHPWLAGEGHLVQSGAPTKQKSLRMVMETLQKLTELDKEGKTVASDDKDAVQLKEFLVQHVGGNSRYLPGIQREMVHLKGIDAKEAPGGIELSEGSALTEEDWRKIRESGIVPFFMNEIVASASTQVEILKEQGTWTKALDKEEKPDPEKGPEVYTYTGEDSDLNFDKLIGGRRQQKHESPKQEGSLRKSILKALGGDDEEITGKVIETLQKSSLFKEGSGAAKALKTLLDQVGWNALLNAAGDRIEDVLISLGLYGEAWMSAENETGKVAFTRGRRSEGVAEYLEEDLEDIAEERAKEEGKPDHVVRSEMNAELSSIPALEKFTDEDLRISPTNPPVGKCLTDITPYVILARKLQQADELLKTKLEDAKKEQGSEQEAAQDRAKKQNEFSRLDALTKALIMVSKVTKDGKQFSIWKNVTGAITKSNGDLQSAHNAIQEEIWAVYSLDLLKQKISQLQEQLNKVASELDEMQGSGMDMFTDMNQDI